MRTRIMIAVAGLSVVAVALPVAAQEVRLTCTARLTIPDFLQLSTVSSTETIDADGARVTRTIVRLNANRSWSLTMNVAQPLDIGSVRVNGRPVDWQVSLVDGRKANSLPVEIEIRWKSASPTEAPLVSYQLSSN